MTAESPILLIIALTAVLSLVGLILWFVYRRFRWIGVVICFASFVLLIVIWALNDNSKARVVKIREEIQKIPNAKLVGISDLDKQASSSISALLEIPGKGKIGFTDLEPESFGHPPEIHIEEIGPFTFCTRTKFDGHQGYGWSIDIGPESPIPDVRALNITNVQTAITHYEELLSLISKLPSGGNGWPTNWPVSDDEWSKTSNEEMHFVNAKGIDFFISVRRNGGGFGNVPPPTKGR
jgi:hypothetical protein